MAGSETDFATAFDTTEGGALRKCPVDIFSERASRRAGKGRERISFGLALTKTTLMLLAEPVKAVGQLRRVLF